VIVTNTVSAQTKVEVKDLLKGLIRSVQFGIGLLDQGNPKLVF